MSWQADVHIGLREDGCGEPSTRSGYRLDAVSAEVAGDARPEAIIRFRESIRCKVYINMFW